MPVGFNLQTATQYWWRAKSVDSSSASSPVQLDAVLHGRHHRRRSSRPRPAPARARAISTTTAASKTLWLNADQAGDFALTANASDAQSGIASVGFPASSARAPTADRRTRTSRPRIRSTGRAPVRLAGRGHRDRLERRHRSCSEHGLGQITISADGAAPAAFRLGGPADTAKIGTGVTVSAAPTDAGSGMRQVAFFYCDLNGGPASRRSRSAPTQTLPAPASTPSAGTRRASPTAITYAVDAVATDNVGHTRASTVNTVTSTTAHRTSRWRRRSHHRQRVPVVRRGEQEALAERDPVGLLQAPRERRAIPTPASRRSRSRRCSAPGSNAGTLDGGAYESSIYSFSSPTAPGLKTISAANGVTDPARRRAATRSTSRSTAPRRRRTRRSRSTTAPTTTRPGTRAVRPRASAARSPMPARASRRCDVSIKDRTTGKYWGGTAFDQPSQTFNSRRPRRQQLELRARPEQADVAARLSRRALLGRQRRQRRDAPADPLHVRQRHRRADDDAHAHRRDARLPDRLAPYVLYYGTTLGGGGFTLHESATDPSGVDTIAFPDLSGTTGFSGSGGTSTNGSSTPIRSSSTRRPTPSRAQRRRAPGLANVTSTDLRGNSGNDSVTFVLDNARADRRHRSP